MRGRLVGIAGLSGLFLAQTACLESFERLFTTVTYDATTQTFEVERRLVGLEPAFFQCHDLPTCEEAIGRVAGLQPRIGMDASLADRLVSRLLDSDAQDLRIELEQRGDHLDALVTYRAAVGTTAAADTLIHAEWAGKKGRERYHLILEAQESYAPLNLPYTVRKQSLGAAASGWREYWVLPPRIREVSTEMRISEGGTPLFAAVEGLDSRLASAGWLGEGVRPPLGEEPQIAVGGPDPEEPQIAMGGSEGEEPSREEPPAEEPSVVISEPVEPVATPGIPPEEVRSEETPEEVRSEETPEEVPLAERIAAPEPEAIPAAPQDEPVLSPEAAPASLPPVAERVAVSEPSVPQETRAERWPAPDPDSLARTWVHEPRLSGELSAQAAQASIQPLIPRVELCYQRRQQVLPELGGYAFLSARVRGDGWLVGTSVYGELSDVELIRCLEEAVQPWTFPPWGGADEIAEVEVPLTFRVEEPPRGRRGRGR